MKKIIRYIDQLTNRIIPNYSAERGARHQVSPYPDASLLSPLFPTRSGLPVVDFRPEGWLINRADRSIQRIETNRGPTRRRPRRSRCTSVAQLPITTAD